VATKKSKRGMHIGVRVRDDTWEALKKYTECYGKTTSGLVNELIINFLRNSDLLLGPLNKFNKDWEE
jgi:hypothetical protein